jgi:hypothetical protein
MNPNHYPPSPAYYRHGNADARDLVTPDYWTDSALVHLMRAGRKDGEPFADAVRNAFTCLALWFRSQSLPVPFYSDALDAAHKRIAELEAAALEAAALTVVESRPVAPALDTSPVKPDPFRDLLEVKTDDDFRAWLKMAGYDPTPDSFHGDRIIRWTMPNTVAVHWDTVTLPGKPWRISVPGVFCAKAEVAARTLHRFLTGAAP